jgi:predicted hydrocarbon binding protein
MVARLRDLGNIKVGRPNLGEHMPVVVYRFFEMAIMSVLSDEYGKERSEELIRKAGYLAGIHLAERTLDKSLSFADFIAQLQELLAEMRIGILRVESSNLEEGHIVLSVYEDLDCSGLPITHEQICVYDEGLIAGILEYYTGTAFEVREIDCWASGENLCRFEAIQQKA